MPRQESNLFEYIDKRAIARFGGNPMLSQFPMEGNVAAIIKVTIRAQV